MLVIGQLLRSDWPYRKNVKQISYFEDMRDHIVRSFLQDITLVYKIQESTLLREGLSFVMIRF